MAGPRRHQVHVEDSGVHLEWIHLQADHELNEPLLEAAVGVEKHIIQLGVEALKNLGSVISRVVSHIILLWRNDFIHLFFGDCGHPLLRCKQLKFPNSKTGPPPRQGGENMNAQSILSPDLFGVPTFHNHISFGKLRGLLDRGHQVFHRIEEVGSLRLLRHLSGFIGGASLVVLVRDLLL